MSYDAPPPSPYGGPPAPARSTNKGTWALVCGILGILCCGVLGIPAIILGRQAQAEGQVGGTARAGEILGYVAVGLMIVVFVLYLAGIATFGLRHS